MTGPKIIFAFLLVSGGFLFTIQGPAMSKVVITFAKIKKNLGIDLPPMENLQIETLPFDHKMGECQVLGKLEKLTILGFKDSEIEIIHLSPEGTNFLTKTPRIEIKGNYTIDLDKCAKNYDGKRAGAFDFQLFNLTLNVGVNVTTDGESKKIIDLDLSWTVKNISLNAENLFNDDEQGKIFAGMFSNYGTNFINMIPPEVKVKFQERVKNELNKYFAVAKRYRKE